MWLQFLVLKIKGKGRQGRQLSCQECRTKARNFLLCMNRSFRTPSSALKGLLQIYHPTKAHNTVNVNTKYIFNYNLLLASISSSIIISGPVHRLTGNFSSWSTLRWRHSVVESRWNTRGSPTLMYADLKVAGWLTVFELMEELIWSSQRQAAGRKCKTWTEEGPG